MDQYDPEANHTGSEKKSVNTPVQDGKNLNEDEAVSPS